MTRKRQRELSMLPRVYGVESGGADRLDNFLMAGRGEPEQKIVYPARAEEQEDDRNNSLAVMQSRAEIMSKRKRPADGNVQSANSIRMDFQIIVSRLRVQVLGLN